MIQRLFLDRIDTKSAAPAVGGEHHSVATALPHETKSALAIPQLAKSRAQPALNAPVRQRHPPAPRIIRLR
jgi:hypothetical protein